MKMTKVARAALLAGVAFTTPAYAQTDNASGNPSASDIIVTAQRRAERLEDVPVSITALNREAMSSAGLKRIDEIQQVSTGVQINKGGVFTQPSVRGITTLTLGYGFENNVAVYVDGLYQADTITINQDLGTIDSIQVLKGPQGTLYGRNATGGAIVIETRAPSKTLTAEFQGSYGRFNDTRTQGYVSGPLTEGIRFSLAVSNRRSDGYLIDIGADPLSTADDQKIAPLQNTAIRAKLELDLADAVVATLGYNHGFVRDDRPGYYVIRNYPNYAATTVPLTCPNPLPACAGQPAYRASARDYVSSNGADSSAATDEFSGKIKIGTDLGDITSYTGYSRRHLHSVFDFDATKSQITFSRNDAIYNYTLQQTIDYNINLERLNLVVGGFFYDDKERIGPGYSLTGASLSLLKTSFVNLDTRAYALYVDATLQVGERIFITGGVRYSDEHRRIRYNEVAGLLAAVAPADKAKSWNAFTPRAVIRYELAPRTNIYASFSKGFRSGVFNPSPAPTPDLALPVDPEKITAYEIGFKTVSGMFRLDTAAWYYDFRNLQVGVSIPNPTVPGGALVQTIGNAKKAESYGMEAQITATPARDLNVRAGLAYIRARYKSFANAVGTGLDLETAISPATNVNVTGQVQDWSGQQMARAPSWTANFGADFSVDVGHGRLNVAGNLSYTSSYIVQNPSLFGPLAGAVLAKKQRYRQSGYALANGQIGWTDAEGHLTIGAYVENLTGKRYTIINSGGAFGDYSQFNEPRTYGLRIGFKF